LVLSALDCQSLGPGAMLWMVDCLSILSFSLKHINYLNLNPPPGELRTST